MTLTTLDPLALIVPPSRLQLQRDDRAQKKLLVNEYVKEHGLFFVYIRDWVNVKKYSFHTDFEIDPKGGTVVAYRIPLRGGHLVEVASSICHTNDCFDKLLGRYYAAKNFHDGKKISLKLKESSRYSYQLRGMLGSEVL